MAAIAMLILEASDYSPDGLLRFWKRVESDNGLQERAERLSREIPPKERVAIFESVMPALSAGRDRDAASTDVAERTVDSGKNDSI